MACGLRPVGLQPAVFLGLAAVGVRWSWAPVGRNGWRRAPESGGRDGMNTLADQVVEFTTTLVRALHRVGQLDPAKAEFPAGTRKAVEGARPAATNPAGDRLCRGPAHGRGWAAGDLGRRHFSPARRAAPSRRPFDRRGLHPAAPRVPAAPRPGLAGLLPRHHRARVERIPRNHERPAGRQDAGWRRQALGPRAARARRSSHVSVVCDAEQPPAQTDLSWQVRAGLRAACCAISAPRRRAGPSLPPSCSSKASA